MGKIKIVNIMMVKWNLIVYLYLYVSIVNSLIKYRDY